MSEITTKVQIPTISINADVLCSKCGKGGAIETRSDGLCLSCATKVIFDKDTPSANPKFIGGKEQQYYPAEEAKEIAERLIQKHHPELLNFRIEYFFLFNTPVVKGKEVWGRAKKISGLNAYLATDEKKRLDMPIPMPFFVIEFSWDVWKELGEKEKEALVDHELSHCGESDDFKPILRSHDCEEFIGVIHRHGLWSSSVKALLDAANDRKETPLFENE